MFKLLTESEKMLKKEKKAKSKLFKNWVYLCDPKKDILAEKQEIVKKLNLFKNKNNKLKIYIKTEIGTKIFYIYSNFYSLFKAYNDAYSIYGFNYSSYWIINNYEHGLFNLKKI